MATTNTPRSQKPDERPISFVLHDTAANTPPREVKLVIRPEDLTINWPSRLLAHQTLGGGWVDDFGAGIPTLTLSGHTGWRPDKAGGPDGMERFSELHKAVFVEWHRLRAEAIKAGIAPDKVKLIFADKLDDITWVVAPTSFVLRRNKTRPLLSQYNIALTYVSADVTSADFPAPAASSDPGAMATAKKSLQSSISKIQKFTAAIQGKIASVLGPIRDQVKSFLNKTAAVLSAVKSAAGAVTGLITGAAGALIGIARDMAQAARNVMGVVSAIAGIPSKIKAAFMEVKSALHNAFCVMKNAFKVQRTLTDYSDMYGASTCSSTAGGSPLSKYSEAGINSFYDVAKTTPSPATVSPAAAASLAALKNIDPVTSMPAIADLKAPIEAVSGGVVLRGAP